MKKLKYFIIFTVILLSSTLLFAHTDKKEEVRIFNILPVTSSYANDELNYVYFSLHNQSGKSLYWVMVRIIIRNPDKEIIHTYDTKETCLFIGEPLASGLTKQLEVYVNVQGFCTSKGHGSIEIELLDYELGDNK
ncbi:MAG: hypothetical protein ACYSTS_18965 [Planctomycetota bacterium]|jgi:hypothetical protein